MGKLLKYIANASTATSDEPTGAEPHLLKHTTLVTCFFQKLSGPDVCFNINSFDNKDILTGV